MDIGGHANLAVPLLHGTDAFLGCLVRVGEVVFDTHHVDGKLDKAAQMAPFHEARP